MKAFGKFLGRLLSATKTAQNLHHRDRIRRWRANYARWRSKATFIAVTGSSGKTTTVALISHILSDIAPVQTQVESNRYGGHIKSLQSALPGNGYYVGEIGAEGPGTLQPILDFLRPSVGVVTLAALEHKRAFRTVEAVAEEKQKLVEALPANALAILNFDDPRVAAMAKCTAARVATFGQSGGDYVLSNAQCLAPGELSLTITHHGQGFDLFSHFTGVHQSLAVAAAFACTHQLGVPPEKIVQRTASFAPIFGRCSLHRVRNGPVFIVDTVKAPYHSLHLALEMMAGFNAPRKRIVIGQISDSYGGSSDKIFRRIYRAARLVADQVIFVGQHSHRSKATAQEIADGHFVRMETVKEAADFLKESAIPGEIVLLKGSGRDQHLERLMLVFFTPVLCMRDDCRKKGTCVSCGLYGVPFEKHKMVSKRQTHPLPTVHLG